MKYENITRELVTRFNQRCVKSPDNGCWLWLGAKNRGGYGQITIPGTKKNITTHRLAYLIGYGVLPEGLNVCHHCDTPACVNPMHLFLGTHKDNVQNKLDKGRFSGGGVGTNNGHAKLTEKQVLAIRIAKGTQSKIAKQFGISQSSVSLIKSERNWSHI